MYYYIVASDFKDSELFSLEICHDFSCPDLSHRSVFACPTVCLPAKLCQVSGFATCTHHCPPLQAAVHWRSSVSSSSSTPTALFASSLHHGKAILLTSGILSGVPTPTGTATGVQDPDRDPVPRPGPHTRAFHYSHPSFLVMIDISYTLISRTSKGLFVHLSSWCAKKILS